MAGDVLEMQDFLMNTVVEQKIFGVAPAAIYSASLSKLRMLEDMMSFYSESSEVSLINHNAGSAATRISAEMMLVLEQAQEYAHVSQSAFNILLAPLVQTWRKAGAENKMPTREGIMEVLALCKIENLILDKNENTAYLSKKGSMIDLGGIGKGFAADACCEIYDEMGASSAFVNLGGNVKAIGNRPDGNPWSVGLQHPDRIRGNCYGVIMCSDLSVVTSGAYERYQEIEGAKYHHIIDGKTGYPSESDLKSVSVISKSSIQADALSTAAFVLGLEIGMDLIYNSECIGAVFFTQANEVYLTKGIKQNVRLLERMPCYEA